MEEGWEGIISHPFPNFPIFDDDVYWTAFYAFVLNNSDLTENRKGWERYGKDGMGRMGMGRNQLPLFLKGKT
jgi:hypothetical protein